MTAIIIIDMVLEGLSNATCQEEYINFINIKRDIFSFFS